jgi:hypothetical protein
MRVIFVGVHNKPDMLPLDSRTRTGRVVDRIIAELPDFQCIKSNLYDIDYFPQNRTLELDNQWVDRWKEMVVLQPDDVVVTLGQCVNEVFRKARVRSVKVGHPSAIWSTKGKEEYIQKVYAKICEQAANNVRVQ